MTTEQIAKRLVELCRKADYETAHKELYAEDAISIEPYPTPDFEQETKGLQAIIEKGRKFISMVQEAHKNEVSEPLVTGNVIAFIIDMDITMKGKDRMAMGELCLYHVKDGKIISEQFFM